MFNLLPGAGLGFAASRDLAFGLGAYSVTTVPGPATRPGGGSRRAVVLDNQYSRRPDDNEIIEILSILFGVIE